MQKRKIHKKLYLTKETVTNLGNIEMQDLNGGTGDTIPSIETTPNIPCPPQPTDDYAYCNSIYVYQICSPGGQ